MDKRNDQYSAFFTPAEYFMEDLDIWSDARDYLVKDKKAFTASTSSILSDITHNIQQLGVQMSTLSLRALLMRCDDISDPVSDLIVSIMDALRQLYCHLQESLSGDLIKVMDAYDFSFRQMLKKDYIQPHTIGLKPEIIDISCFQNLPEDTRATIVNDILIGIMRMATVDTMRREEALAGYGDPEDEGNYYDGQDDGYINDDQYCENSIDTGHIADIIPFPFTDGSML